MGDNNERIGMDWRMVAIGALSLMGVGGAGTLAGARIAPGPTPEVIAIRIEALEDKLDKALANAEEPGVVSFRLGVVEQQLGLLSTQVTALQSAIDRTTSSRWTREDHERYAEEQRGRMQAVRDRVSVLERAQ